VRWAGWFALAAVLMILDANEIARLQDRTTQLWHGAEDFSAEKSLNLAGSCQLLELALGNHRANFDLWHEEDKAREPGASDAIIAEVKHNIDRLNQHRNDLIEAMDRLLLEAAGHQSPEAPLHSETPGLILDRLSILALKIFHTEEEAHRQSATEAHRQRNRARLALLKEQRDDLVGCLDSLWADVLTQRRRFKLYRQMKMYNDPELNPAIYKHRASAVS